MKPIILLISISLMIGCVKKETPKDCHCDRIIRVIHRFDIIKDNGQIYYQGGAITINDCSGEQRERDLGNYVSKPSQKVGDCLYN